jgi:hypothetical protein
MSNLTERLTAASETCKLRVGDYRGLCAEAAAEIARLRARPTEEQVQEWLTQDMMLPYKPEALAKQIHRCLLALFPKVQP